MTMTFGNYVLQLLQNGVCILFAGVMAWVAVAFVFQKITNSMRNHLGAILGDKFFIYLTAPGVAIHELGHAFFCLVFRHKITEMKLFSPEDDGTLGYVNHSYDPKNFYHRIGNFFIGTGPVWCGLFLLAVVSKLLLPESMLATDADFKQNADRFFNGFFSGAFWRNWRSYLWIYLTLTISAHITLSKPDLKGALDGFLFLLLLIFGVCLLFGWCGNWEDIVIAWQLNFLKRFLPLLSMTAFLQILTVLILKMLPHRHG